MYPEEAAGFVQETEVEDYLSLFLQDQAKGLLGHGILES